MTAGWTLIGIGHDRTLVVEPGQPRVVGRGADTDLVVPHVTVSRRHAELEATASGLAVRDLGSANGTRINGSRIETGDLLPGDAVTFGKVTFRLAPPEGAAEPATDGTVSRAVVSEHPDEGLAAHQLRRILELARQLSGELDFDKLTTAIVDLTFDLLPVDRVSLLLVDQASGELVPARSKSRFGDGASVRVPRSIARRAAQDKVPILTENAADDERFRSGSVMLQSVRGAISTPLLAGRDRVLGVLYVDSLTADRPFREDEAGMLFAFGGLAAVGLGQLAYAEETRREAQVRANFERFFAPGVASRIARERGAIRLAGERRPAAVLFTDIRGFTAIAESLSPDTLGELLTEYFTEMADVVFEHGGTLDKFVGDAILAVWGAPLAAPDDADRALAAALAMQRQLAALNAHAEERGRPRLGIGIGITYGEVFAGYLGSERRMEYSVIGDTVNVASRLSGEAAAGEIRMSVGLVERLTTRPPVERLPDVPVRGRRLPVPVYRIATASA